jgi:hypothetical protein
MNTRFVHKCLWLAAPLKIQRRLTVTQFAFGWAQL